jgi:hypothetical protein
MRLQHRLSNGAALIALVFVASAHGEEMRITGKKNVVCATQDILACGEGAVCVQGKPSTFDMPAFMFADVGGKEIRAVDADGTTIASPIKTFEVTEQSAIMQGYENHRGWTLAIDKTDGSFALSATGGDVNFTIMGACTEL